MRDVPDLFATLANALEDLHAISVEGDQPDLSPDMQEALLGLVRNGMADAHRIMLQIAVTLP